MSSVDSHPESNALTRNQKRRNRTRLSALTVFLVSGALLGFAAFRGELPHTLQFWTTAELPLAENDGEFVIARIQYTARNRYRDFEAATAEDSYFQNTDGDIAHTSRHSEDAHGLPT